MTFEERLLVAIQEEMARRAARRGRLVRGARRLSLAMAAVLVAAVPAVVPLTNDGRAYAMTENHDGSITVRIKEFRRPDRLQAELAGRGARTDITYLPPHRQCVDGPRGVLVDPQPPASVQSDPKRLREFVRRHPNMPSQQAFSVVSARSATFRIFPAHIGHGQTLVLELAESMTTSLWKVKPFLVAGPVKPCVLRNDPTWN